MKTKTTTEMLPTIEKEAAPLISQIASINILHPQDMLEATDLLSKFNKYLDLLIDDKEKLTKPLNEALKEVRSRYKPTEEMLEKSILIIRKAMSSYQTAETARIEAEAAKIADRVGDGKGKIKIETAVKKIEEINTLDKKTSTQNGSVTFKPTKMFEVIDISKLPIAYVLPNEAAIRIAMKEGTEITGVKYWVEQVPVNRR